MALERDGRGFIKVHNGIEDHPKVALLSDKAFRLLITTWGWCSRHTTDGLIPLAIWRQRGNPKTRRELEAQLVHGHGHTCECCQEVPEGHVLMHDYLGWQSSAAEVDEKLEGRRRAARLANHVRHHEDKNVLKQDCEFCAEQPPDPPNGDPELSDRTSEPESEPESEPDPDSSIEVEVEVEKELRDFPSRPPVGDARPKTPGVTGPAGVRAYRLVGHVLGRSLTSATRTALAIEVATLLAEVDEPTLAAALERWNSRTGISPRLLPSLVDDIRKEARGATTRPPPTTANTTDAYAAQFLASNQNPPPLRALPGGA